MDIYFTLHKRVRQRDVAMGEESSCSSNYGSDVNLPTRQHCCQCSPLSLSLSFPFLSFYGFIIKSLGLKFCISVVSFFFQLLEIEDPKQDICTSKPVRFLFFFDFYVTFCINFDFALKSNGFFF